MKHVHAFDTISHRGVSPELMEMGIQLAELRKCKTCHKEVPFLQTKKGVWIPLYDDREASEQDILLA